MTSNPSLDARLGKELLMKPHLLWEVIEVRSPPLAGGARRWLSFGNHNEQRCHFPTCVHIECHVGHVDHLPPHENPQQHQTLVKAVGQEHLVLVCEKRAVELKGATETLRKTSGRTIRDDIIVGLSEQRTTFKKSCVRPFIIL